jgi:hypothetical protein
MSIIRMLVPFFTFWGMLELNGFHCVRQRRPLHLFKIPLNAGGIKNAQVVYKIQMKG